jgi:hypothetical protein
LTADTWRRRNTSAPRWPPAARTNTGSSSPVNSVRCRRLASASETSGTIGTLLAAPRLGHRRGEVDRGVLLGRGGTDERVDLPERVEVVVAQVADRLGLDAGGRVLLDPTLRARVPKDRPDDRQELLGSQNARQRLFPFPPIT